jgi:hypothetical protein
MRRECMAVSCGFCDTDSHRLSNAEVAHESNRGVVAEEYLHLDKGRRLTHHLTVVLGAGAPTGRAQDHYFKRR